MTRFGPIGSFEIVTRGGKSSYYWRDNASEITISFGLSSGLIFHVLNPEIKKKGAYLNFKSKSFQEHISKKKKKFRIYGQLGEYTCLLLPLTEK